MSTSFWILLGKSRHRPSTSRLELISAQHCLKRVANARGVSSQALGGIVVVRRCRSHETAVSWIMTQDSEVLDGDFGNRSPRKLWTPTQDSEVLEGYFGNRSPRHPCEPLDSDPGLRSFRGGFRQSESSEALDSDPGLRSFRGVFRQSESAAPL